MSHKHYLTNWFNIIGFVRVWTRGPLSGSPWSGGIEGIDPPPPPPPPRENKGEVDSLGSILYQNSLNLQQISTFSHRLRFRSHENKAEWIPSIPPDGSRCQAPQFWSIEWHNNRTVDSSISHWTQSRFSECRFAITRSIRCSIHSGDSTGPGKYRVKFASCFARTFLINYFSGELDSLVLRKICRWMFSWGIRLRIYRDGKKYLKKSGSGYAEFCQEVHHHFRAKHRRLSNHAPLACSSRETMEWRGEYWGGSQPQFPQSHCSSSICITCQSSLQLLWRELYSYVSEVAFKGKTTAENCR